MRSVAHGIKITCPLNLTTAAGYVHIASYTLNTQGKSTWALPTTVAGIQDLPGYKRVTLQSLTQNPLIVVNKFLRDYKCLDVPDHVLFAWSGSPTTYAEVITQIPQNISAAVGEMGRRAAKLGFMSTNAAINAPDAINKPLLSVLPSDPTEAKEFDLS